MPGVFRRRWFPRLRLSGTPGRFDATLALTGVSTTAQVGDLDRIDTTLALTGGPTTAQVGSFSQNINSNKTLDGVQATAQIGAAHLNLTFTLIGLEALAEVGAFSGAGFPSDRVFVVAGRNQQVLPPGTAMYPTSETVNLGSNPYIIASSQFYTIGQVSWSSVVRTEGVDWRLVDPFTHIIEILTLPSVGTPIELIFFRWDIGVTAGFEVTSYPVQFSFINTMIIAEKVPAISQFFTVNFVRERPLANPTTFFAIYPLIVDDVWAFHAQYDAPNGFQTYRPTGYRVVDLALSRIFEWDGAVWHPSTVLVTGNKFYVKALRGVYILEGSAILPVFEAGDPADLSYPQALTYPNYGEGIGKNLLVDAFSVNAAVDYPAAYEVAISPGDFDPWVSG